MDKLKGLGTAALISLVLSVESAQAEGGKTTTAKSLLLAGLLAGSAESYAGGLTSEAEVIGGVEIPYEFAGFPAVMKSRESLLSIIKETPDLSHSTVKKDCFESYNPFSEEVMNPIKMAVMKSCQDLKLSVTNAREVALDEKAEGLASQGGVLDKEAEGLESDNDGKIERNEGLVLDNDGKIERNEGLVSQGEKLDKEAENLEAALAALELASANLKK